MGDISRHRDIFLNTRQAIPPGLLSKCKIAVSDLTYLELGNYFTDVSQFRDPVTYIFAKQRVWREKILPSVEREGAETLRAALTILAHLGAAGALARGSPKAAGGIVAAGALLTSVLSNDLIADIYDLDEWIDKMLGTPYEQAAIKGTRRPDKDYGYIGQFFQHFIEGITHLLFAAEIQSKVKGEWGTIDRIPETQVSAVFKEFFTQYYPHEHTDQPPYIWDASKRPSHPNWYGRSTRQDGLALKGGIMNAVDDHYIQYLSEELSKLEDEFRKIKSNDMDARRRWLVRMGKILHGVEDWYFHSNIVELINLHSHARRAGENDEQFLQRFVDEVIVDADATKRLRLQRRLYRRLRFPVYERGTKKHSAGIVSTSKSTLSLDHAYPAFPSQQDTAHTLLAALENLERKAKPDGGSAKLPSQIPPWAPPVLLKYLQEGGEVDELIQQKAQARGVKKEDVLLDLASPGGPKTDKVEMVIVDVLREWLPLVVTLLNESERQRLVADVAPLLWPAPPGQTPPRSGSKQEPKEIEDQLKRHKAALEPKTNAQGIRENNYQRAARYLRETGFINPRGEQALRKAFEIDHESQKINKKAPGAGGFLMQFAIELQETLDKGDAATEALNKKAAEKFNQASDNGAFTEIIGSHSLMSKDTLASSPFFDDAKVLASVASQSIFRIMLEEVSSPADGKGVYWPKILRHFIRFPVALGGWERRAMTFFRDNNGKKIPTYADLPELARLAQSARIPLESLQQLRKGDKATKLEEEYIKVEKERSHYRRP